MKAPFAAKAIMDKGTQPLAGSQSDGLLRRNRLSTARYRIVVSRRKLIVTLEQVAAIFTLFIMTRPLQPYMRLGGIDLQFLMIAAIMAYVFIYLFLTARRSLWVMLQDKWLLSMVGLAVASVIWSADRSTTTAELITFLGATAFGVYLAMRFNMREQVMLIAFALGMACLLSLAVSAMLPQIGRATIGGVPNTWIGIYDHKNTLGRYAAIAAVAFWLLRTETRTRLFGYAGFALCMALILLAQSATALLSTLVTLAALPIYRTFHWRRSYLRALILFAGIAIGGGFLLYFWADSAAFFELLGRDAQRNTFYVRLTLWQDLMAYIRERPLLGYGFEGFWQGGRTFYSWTPAGWEVAHAHSGYVETVLQLGIVGLALVAGHLLLNLRRAIRMIRVAPSLDGLWLAAFTTIMVGANLTYSTLMGKLTAPWAMYVAATLSILLVLRSRLNAVRHSNHSQTAFNLPSRPSREQADNAA